LQDKATNWVDKVLANQEEDGYLGAYGKDDDRIYAAVRAAATAGRQV